MLGHAEAWRLRLVVLTGPVLAPDDPVYRGMGMPRLYWKVVAWADTRADAGADGDRMGPPALAATAFVLDQSPQRDAVELRDATARALAADEAPPLGPFRTFQVPVGDVAAHGSRPRPAARGGRAGDGGRAGPRRVDRARRSGRRAAALSRAPSAQAAAAANGASTRSHPVS